MEILIVPICSALLATALCIYGCLVFGMPQADLRIAALVSGFVSLSPAVGAAWVARPRRQSR
jgi:hypothetical protein